MTTQLGRVVWLCLMGFVASFSRNSYGTRGLTLEEPGSTSSLTLRDRVDATSTVEIFPFPSRSSSLGGPFSSPHQSLKFAILGGGAFSLALSKVLSYKNISSSMLVRSQDVADAININHYHPKYLTSSQLPPQLWATSDPVLALKNADYIIHAVPMQESRKFLGYIKPYLPPNAPILSVTKGVEQSTFCLMNDVIFETLGEERKAAFLSGPSFAKEIMNGEATAVVIASTDEYLASELSDILSCDAFRCHTSKDVKVSYPTSYIMVHQLCPQMKPNACVCFQGVELGGAIKNVIALAAGMCEGLGLGMNAMSSLVTRGCMEMGRCDTGMSSTSKRRDLRSFLLTM